MNADSVEAVEARENLRQALLRLAEHDQATPCAKDDRFTADDLETLVRAAQECARCPVQAECAAAGQYEVWGVWAGRVIGPKQLGRKPKDKAS